jgi:hypothetical protein
VGESGRRSGGEVSQALETPEMELLKQNAAEKQRARASRAAQAMKGLMEENRLENWVGGRVRG